MTENRFLFHKIEINKNKQNIRISLITVLEEIFLYFSLKKIVFNARWCMTNDDQLKHRS